MFGKSKTDELFFDAFLRHGRATLEAAKHVRSLFDELPNASDLARAISEAEHLGDQITQQTMRRLHETWITPFDRADIHTLISRMDDVLDLTEAVSERVLLFEISTARPHAKELADLLVKCAETMLRTMELLPNLKSSKELLELCAQIGKLENDADVIYRKAIATLFKPGNDPLEVMKWRDIYDALETATDRCADVADVIEGVVLEYA
jgi:predicted phosphate transport protein (TIGR00153 family)